MPGTLSSGSWLQRTQIIKVLQRHFSSLEECLECGINIRLWAKFMIRIEPVRDRFGDQEGMGLDG